MKLEQFKQNVQFCLKFFSESWDLYTKQILSVDLWKSQAEDCLTTVTGRQTTSFLTLFNLETPGDQIVRKLTFERIEELKKSIRNDQLTYK